MNDKFDFNEALEQIKAGAKIDGKDGVLAPLRIKGSGDANAKFFFAILFQA